MGCSSPEFTQRFELTWLKLCPMVCMNPLGNSQVGKYPDSRIFSTTSAVLIGCAIAYLHLVNWSDNSKMVSFHLLVAIKNLPSLQRAPVRVSLPTDMVCFHYWLTGAYQSPRIGAHLRPVPIQWEPSEISDISSVVQPVCIPDSNGPETCGQSTNHNSEHRFYIVTWRTEWCNPIFGITDAKS